MYESIKKTQFVLQVKFYSFTVDKVSKKSNRKNQQAIIIKKKARCNRLVRQKKIIIKILKKNFNLLTHKKYRNTSINV